MRKLALIFLAFCLLVVFTACGRNEMKLHTQDNSDVEIGLKPLEDEENDALGLFPKLNTSMEQKSIDKQNIVLYFFDKGNNQLVSEIREVFSVAGKDVALKIVKELIEGPNTEGLMPVLPRETKILDIEQTENIVSINLSSDFKKARDLLVAKAALVNTLTSIEGVKFIKIFIDGNELTDNGEQDGNVLGLLTQYPVSIDEIVKQLREKELNPSTIKEVDRILYFSDCHSTFLLPEARRITLKDNELARAVVEELIKGPINIKEGLRATISPNIQLLKIKLVEPEILYNDADRGLELYFSKEFLDEYPQGSANELVTLGSLVYSLTDLPNIEWVKIYYQNIYGDFIDKPIHNLDISRPLTRQSFGNILGRKLKIYFSDENAMNLVPEYRAMPKDNLAIANTIIKEIVAGPVEANHTKVLPNDIRIKVWMDGDTAIVSLPVEVENNKWGSAGEIMTFYSIVNSLTDPVNTKNIDKVQFLIDGKKVEGLGNVSLKEPFTRNPVLIKEQS